MDADEAEPSTKRRRYAFSKCDQCRKDKKGCEPKDRQSHQKCDRCEKKGFQCSNNTIAAAARQMKSRSTPEDPPFNTRLDRFLKAWQWLKSLDHQSQDATHLDLNKTLEAIVTRLSNKLSPELTQLYREAKDAKNLPAQALLGQLCYPGTMSEFHDKMERLAVSAILETPLTKGGTLPPTNGLRLELLDVRWSSGDTHNCLRILHSEIDRQLQSSFGVSDKQWECLISLTKKCIEYCEDFGSKNSQIYKDNYLNMVQDIPDLDNVIDLRQHMNGATMDKNQRYLQWLLHYKPELSKLADARGDTLLHRACMSTLFLGDTTGPAVSHILSMGQGLHINRQNIWGETALHRLCALICRAIIFLPGPFSTFLITLRQLLLYPGIDVDVRDAQKDEKEGGEVASSYLVQCWAASPENKARMEPFLKCFAETHPMHLLAWKGTVWYWTDFQAS